MVTGRVYHQSSEIDQVLSDLYNQGIEDVIGTALCWSGRRLGWGHYIWSVDGKDGCETLRSVVALASVRIKRHKLAAYPANNS